MDYQVKLDSFTGPLDLLIHLIEKEEIDIYAIPIARITEEYISYLATIEELNLDNISDFMLMALELLQIKAALLLPDSPQAFLEEDSGEEIGQAEDLQQELLEKLLEYRKFKKAARTLGEWESLQKNVYCRLPEGEEKEEFVLGEISVKQLLVQLQKVMKKKEIKKDLTRVIILEEFTVEERMEQISQLVLNSTAPLEFTQIFLQDKNRLAVITSFLALLELIKLKKIKAQQKNPFASIFIIPYSEGE